MGLMAYDPERLLDLRVALAQSLTELQALRCDDTAAHDAMRVVREACKVIDDRCLPFVREVLDSSAMTAWDRRLFESCETRTSIFWQVSHERQWLLHDDPAELDRGETLVPPTPLRGHAPLFNSYDDVMAARTCGELAPLRVPTDPNRPADQQYTNIGIAPTNITLLGEHEITRNIARFIGFWSDALPIGYHEHKVRAVYRVDDAHVVATVHALDPTGEQFPIGLSEATVSGYIVMVDLTKDVGVNVPMGQHDPTQSIAISIDHDSQYAVMLYPDAQPVFRPATLTSPLTEPTWRLSTQPLLANGAVGSWGSKDT